MTENTKNVAIVIWGLPPFTSEEVDSIAKELSDLIKKYCGGETDTFLLNASKKEAEF